MCGIFGYTGKRQAQGLILVDIARRLGTDCHGARRLAAAGLLRLERLERKQEAKSADEQARQGRGPPGADGNVVSRREIAALFGLDTQDSRGTGKEQP